MKKYILFVPFIFLLSCMQSVFEPLGKIDKVETQFHNALKIIRGMRLEKSDIYDTLDTKSRMVSVDMYKSFEDYSVVIYSVHDRNNLYFYADVGYYGYTEKRSVEFRHRGIKLNNRLLSQNEMSNYFRLRNNDSLWTLVSEKPFWDNLEGFKDIFNKPLREDLANPKKCPDYISITGVGMTYPDAQNMEIGAAAHLNPKNTYNDCNRLSLYIAVKELENDYWKAEFSDYSVILPEVLKFEEQFFVTMLYRYEDSSRKHLPVIAENKGNKLIYLRLEDMIVDQNQNEIEKLIVSEDLEKLYSKIIEYYNLPDSINLSKMYDEIRVRDAQLEDTLYYNDFVYLRDKK